MTPEEAKKLRLMTVGLLRLVDDEAGRVELLRRLSSLTRRAMAVWVRDHSGFPKPLKDQILSALQRAENGTLGEEVKR